MITMAAVTSSSLLLLLPVLMISGSVSGAQFYTVCEKLPADDVGVHRFEVPRLVDDDEKAAKPSNPITDYISGNVALILNVASF